MVNVLVKAKSSHIYINLFPRYNYFFLVEGTVNSVIPLCPTATRAVIQMNLLRNYLSFKSKFKLSTPMTLSNNNNNKLKLYIINITYTFLKTTKTKADIFPCPTYNGAPTTYEQYNTDEIP